MMKRILLTAGLAGLVCVASESWASAGANEDTALQNWPQWRGPTGNGVAPTADPPVDWGQETNLKWKTALPGEGHSTPIIWEEKIFVLAAVPTSEVAEVEEAAEVEETRPDERRRGGRPGRRGGFGGRSVPRVEHEFVTICLDRESGRVLWKKVGRKEVPHEGKHPTNSYASGSPVTDGEHVYSFFGSRGLFCYDLDGNLVWEKDLGDMRTRNGFGEGASPALHQNTLIVLWDNEDQSFVYAFDKKTGDELWRRERDERSSWSTPYVLTHQGVTQVVINASNAVRSYNLATGELLWECAGQTANAIPSVVADEHTVYAMSGFRGNAAVAIELGHRGDLTGTEAVRWEWKRGTPYVPSPLLYEGLLFFCQNNNGIVSCLDADSGEPYFSQERLEDVTGVYASPTGAAGRIYVIGRDGKGVVLERGKKLNVLAQNDLRENVDASPVLVGKQLFIRGHRHLYCFEEDSAE